MKSIIQFEDVKEKVIRLRDQEIILDSDVAILYGVETKRINEALRNNPEKFPQGYVFPLMEEEWDNLRSKISTAKLNKARYVPKAFTEKGLYMLATILKSPRATETTIAIVEAFAKIRELSRTIAELTQSSDPSQQKSLMQKSSDIIADFMDEDLKTTETETCIELNLAVLKIKHTITRKTD